LKKGELIMSELNYQKLLLTFLVAMFFTLSIQTSAYAGVIIEIDIEKLTNGEDADTPPGPQIPVGDDVLWEYIVSNVGVEVLTNIQVTDDQVGPVSCPQNFLFPSESMTCTGHGRAQEGQYVNIGTATGDLGDNGPGIEPVNGPAIDTDPSHYVGVIVNQPPIADAGPDQSYECTSPSGADVTLDGSRSSDPDGDALTYLWTWDGVSETGVTPTINLPFGTITVTLEVDDGNGATDTDTVIVEVLDTTPPDILCNAPATITPIDAPISFTATATDSCAGDPSVEITSYDCFTFTKKGKRIDKTESCIVNLDDDTITIMDTGGVGDHIIWTVRSTDDAGNVSEYTCGIITVKPSK
jgi:hypothetical protein